MSGPIHADVGGLSGDAAALQASAAPASSPTVVTGPGLDAVSTALAAHVNALAQSLDAHFAAAEVQRGAAAGTTASTAGMFEQVDAANAAALQAVGNGGAEAPLPGSSPPSPAAGLPAAPPVVGAVPPPVVGEVEVGEAFSAAIHGGPGAASLQAAAATWRTRHSVEERKAALVAQAASSIRSNWQQGSGANTAAEALTEHGAWSREALGHAAGLARLADRYAQAYEVARSRTPTPAVFSDLRNKLVKAKELQAEYGPRYTPLVVNISQAIVDKQGDANNAASAFQQAVTSASTEVGKALDRASDIVKPAAPGKGPTSGSDTGHQAGTQPGTPDDDGAGFGAGATNPLQGADPAPGNPAAADPANPAAVSSVGEIAGTIMGAAMGALTDLSSAGGGSGLASGLPSALQGLHGLGSPSMPSPTSGSGGEPASQPPPDTGGDPEGATAPAAGDDAGGGGAGGGEGGGSTAGGALGASTVSAAPSVGSNPGPGGPAASAGGAGGGMMAPPMMGGRKGGETHERNRALSPDKRLLLRPRPNIEPVLGEAEIKRAKRDKEKGEP